MSAATDGFLLVDGVGAGQLAPGEMRGVVMADGRRLCIGNRGDAYFAVRDACTHAEFPLSEGTLYPTGELECCWHGARFDCRSGAVLRGPAEDPLALLEVRVIDGALWVRT